VPLPSCSRVTQGSAGFLERSTAMAQVFFGGKCLCPIRWSWQAEGLDIRRFSAGELVRGVPLKIEELLAGGVRSVALNGGLLVVK